MKLIVRILSIAFISFCLSMIAGAATFVVNTTLDTADVNPGDGVCSDGSTCSLRAAISEANSLAGADAITLPAGVYTQSLSSGNDDANVGGDWDIAGDLTINGADADTTIVQAAAAPGTAHERVFDIRSGTVTLNNLTVRNGNFSGLSASALGAGIENFGNLTLDHCVVTDNRLTPGGGIGAGVYNQGSALTLESTSVVSNINTSQLGGGNFGVGISSLSARRCRNTSAGARPVGSQRHCHG
jgi:CSLREA domain-containing protein